MWTCFGGYVKSWSTNDSQSHLKSIYSCKLQFIDTTLWKSFDVYYLIIMNMIVYGFPKTQYQQLITLHIKRNRKFTFFVLYLFVLPYIIYVVISIMFLSYYSNKYLMCETYFAKKLEKLREWSSSCLIGRKPESFSGNRFA